MFKFISNYKNLFVANISVFDQKNIKIIYSEYPNFQKGFFVPYATDIENDCPIIVSSSQHIKKLNYYVNRLGMPKKNIKIGEKQNQQIIVAHIKQLRKQRKI